MLRINFKSFFFKFVCTYASCYRDSSLSMGYNCLASDHLALTPIYFLVWYVIFGGFGTYSPPPSRIQELFIFYPRDGSFFYALISEIKFGSHISMNHSGSSYGPHRPAEKSSSTGRLLEEELGSNKAGQYPVLF